LVVQSDWASAGEATRNAMKPPITAGKCLEVVAGVLVDILSSSRNRSIWRNQQADACYHIECAKIDGRYRQSLNKSERN
jgi:hypothetical protein